MKSNTELMQLFAAVLKAENAISAIQTELTEATNQAKVRIADHQTAAQAAWDEINAHMQETGEYELILPGQATNYKIDYTTPRESVKVDDPAAAPDEFVKLERKLMLKEIGTHLKELREAGKPLPNWARFELGEKRLQWKAIKK